MDDQDKIDTVNQAEEIFNSAKEAFPFTDEEREENKKIADRIRIIVAKYKRKDLTPEDFPNTNIVLTSELAPNIDLQLADGLVREWKLQDSVIKVLPEGFPEWFNFPNYFFAVSYSKEKRDQGASTTKEGILDSYFVGADGEVYSTRNTLTFNLEGQAIKSENIHQVNKDQFSYFKPPINPEDFRRVDFIPQEGLSFVPLAPGDYENVYTYLDRVDSGEFRLER